MEDFKNALLDFVKFQNIQQLQQREWIETHQFQFQEKMEKLLIQTQKENQVKSEEKQRGYQQK